MKHASIVTFAGAHGDDRAHARSVGKGVLLCVADGAGGTAGAAAAAQFVVDCVSQVADPSAVDWVDHLTELDSRIAAMRDAGETTAVVAYILGRVVCGASVGDSGALMFAPTDTLDLTAAQQRKPLIGSGSACPVRFEAELVGPLLVATDGLIKYVSLSSIREVALAGDVHRAVTELVERARLPSGALQDDMAIAMAA